jgi:ATP-dependent DNA helicase DinG
MAKGELLRRFREQGNAVLLGTGSFWEGVDVRGEALSCVIIDKLPFASPGDPVVAARIDAMKARRQNPFIRYQLPSAIIAMKQGAGRLIRDEADTGLLMVCDPRLVGRPYGQLFLQSMPPMRRTRSLEEVKEFFAMLDTINEAART